jgi:hypothetical protein
MYVCILIIIFLNRYKDKARLLEMEHKKAYRILEEIFKSDKDNCRQFLSANHKKIKKLLMTSLNKVADSSKAARLRLVLCCSLPVRSHRSSRIISLLMSSLLEHRPYGTRPNGHPPTRTGPAW